MQLLNYYVKCKEWIPILGNLISISKETNVEQRLVPTLDTGDENKRAPITMALFILLSYYYYSTLEFKSELDR